jgi:hypothetical protein
MQEPPVPNLFLCTPYIKGRLGEHIRVQSARANQTNPLHSTCNLLASPLFFSFLELHTRHTMYTSIRVIAILLFTASTVSPALSASLRYDVQLVLLL